MFWQRVIAALCLLLATAQAVHALSLDEQRQLFLDTEKEIQKGHVSQARSNIESLGDYPLIPYLELSLMLENIHNASEDEVNAFLHEHAGSWLAEKLRLNWLIVLDARKKYSDYIQYYVESEPTTVSTCRYAEALIRTGQPDKAYELAPKLWLHGGSRPNECDYVFSQWRKSGEFSEDYLWKRFLLARNAGETGLASYLRRQAKSEQIEKQIDLYYQIQKNPALILDPKNILVSGSGYSDLIKYGIRRLGAEDPYKAETSFKYYLPRLTLTEQEKSRLLEAIQRGYTENGDADQALRLARDAGRPISETHADWHLKQALKEEDWQRTLDWIALLLPEDAELEKWRYWKARAQNQLGQSSAGIYVNVAKERSYYGFLSAMMIEQPYTLGHSPVLPNRTLADDLKQRPGVARARELHAVGYYNNARRAWNYAVSDLTRDQHTIAAGVALELDLYYEAIRSMAAAKYWSDLDIRFPLAYLENYSFSADSQAVELSWIYGISRQESSFAPDIRSRSGAMGLMQVMPATAREMARDIGVRYERDKLVEPEYNIPLGTAYLSKGKQELYDNMVYATAGYNAGINAARRWLEDGRDKLPLDIWIETIPYSETRNYVKNVLAYSVIFADKLGRQSPMERHSNQFFTGMP